ncbi:uncharacterized protein [Amphiura filiformis]|uniref:uncharacterized protein n=1 Tax=Amphiura filiformis TaxID=82378 RepID=UPI003B211F36
MTGQREPGTPSQTVGPDMSRLPTFKPLVVSTYNVRTLHQQGKTHQLFTGCSDAGVDIVGVQEHRLITSSPTDELCNLRRSFYNPLEDHLEKVKRHNIHLVIGDFNARIGQDSHVSHPAVVGPHCFYDTTNDNGERLVNLCQEFKLRPSQSRFPQPKSRLWTWMHPTGSKHQLDHILVNSKWVNSLRNCRAYNSVELDSDHRILSIRLHTSLRTTKGKPCKRLKYNWKKLLHAPAKNRFQIELSNRFQVLQCDDNDQSPISERYEMFEKVVEEVAEEVVGKCSPCGMPSWVTDKTLKLRSERDAAKKTYLLVRTHHAREVWRKLNTQLNESYRADELASIHRQMEDLQVANENGNYNTTWKIIHDISGKKKRSNPKVKKRDGTIPSSDKELLAEWKDYFCALLNNDNGPPTSDLPPPADQDLPICADPLPWKRQEKPFKQ